MPETRPLLASSNAVLVPLTNSLYVKGELSNTETVLVDVGTGFLIEKVSEERPRVIASADLPLPSEIKSCASILR